MATNLQQYIGVDVTLTGFGFFAGLTREAQIRSIVGGTMTVGYPLDSDHPHIEINEDFTLNGGTYTDTAGWRATNGWRVDYSSLPSAFYDRMKEAEKRSERRANRRARRKSSRTAKPKKPQPSVALMILKGVGESDTLTYENDRAARRWLRGQGHAMTSVEKGEKPKPDSEGNFDRPWLWTLDLRIEN